MTDSNVAGSSAGGGSGPCGACKFLRRKCAAGCIFAPYFDSEQGPAQFAAVHKVFGASNFSKLLLHIPVHHRPDAVVSVCYEARARLGDPVYGCVSHIFALQQQVVNLQAELSHLQARLSTGDPPPLQPPPPPPSSLSIDDLPISLTMPASYDMSSLLMDSAEVHSFWTTLHRHRPSVDLQHFLTSSASGSHGSLDPMPSSSTKDADEDFSESSHKVLNKKEPSMNNQSSNLSPK